MDVWEETPALLELPAENAETLSNEKITIT